MLDCECVLLTVDNPVITNSLTDAGIQSSFAYEPYIYSKEITRLSSAERAMLIDILWESLDEESIRKIEGKWAVESEERIDAVDRGDLQTLDGPSALHHLRSSLRK
jgi:hypothetical protein